MTPNQRDAYRNNLMVVFGMTPILLYVAELPIAVPDTTIFAISSIVLGLMIPVIGLATRIKLKRIKAMALTAGFVVFLTTALNVVQSKVETGFGVLSTDVTTLDFKLSTMMFVVVVGLTAIGLITGMYRLRADSDPRRYM